MKTLKAKELKGLVNKGLDMTIKDIETMKPEAYSLMLEATKELVTRNIKASDKEIYQSFLETLTEYAPAGLPKVANKKAPKKDTKKDTKKEGKKEDKKPAKKPAKKEGKKEDKKPAKKITDKIEVGDIVKFQVEGEEIQHDIKIVYKGKNNIIGVMAEDEKEVFNIRKSDFNKQMFAWTDRHNETYNIIVTL